MGFRVAIMLLLLVAANCSDGPDSLDPDEPGLITPDGPLPELTAPPCDHVEQFGEAHQVTGSGIDRGPAAEDPSDHLFSSNAVVRATLGSVVDHPTDPAWVIHTVDVSEVIEQYAGPDLERGALEVAQRRAEDDPLRARLFEHHPAGAEVVLFLFIDPSREPGWQFMLEGLWVACRTPDGAPSLGGDVIRTSGWAEISTLGDLVVELRRLAAEVEPGSITGQLTMEPADSTERTTGIDGILNVRATTGGRWHPAIVRNGTFSIRVPPGEYEIDGAGWTMAAGDQQCEPQQQVLLVESGGAYSVEVACTT